MAFSTNRVRDNQFVLELLDTGGGQRSVTGIDSATQIADLETAVAGLQSVITDAAASAVTIGADAATFQTAAAETGGAADYAVTVAGSVTATTVTATDIYAQTYHTLCPYKVVIADGKEVFHISETGDAGLGTASPAARLHVVGDVIIEGDLEVRGNIVLRGGGKIIYRDD